jgi:hypothetical protein
MKTKIAAALTALALTVAVTLPSDAEARGRGGLLAAGLIGGALVGAAIASQSHAAPAYYYGEPRRCRWVAQYDGWGNYMGRSRVCYGY